MKGSQPTKGPGFLVLFVLVVFWASYQKEEESCIPHHTHTHTRHESSTIKPNGTVWCENVRPSRRWMTQSDTAGPSDTSLISVARDNLDGGMLKVSTQHLLLRTRMTDVPVTFVIDELSE